MQMSIYHFNSQNGHFVQLGASEVYAAGAYDYSANSYTYNIPSIRMSYEYYGGECVCGNVFSSTYTGVMNISGLLKLYDINTLTKTFKASVSVPVGSYVSGSYSSGGGCTAYYSCTVPSSYKLNLVFYNDSSCVSSNDYNLTSTDTVFTFSLPSLTYNRIVIRTDSLRALNPGNCSASGSVYASFGCAPNDVHPSGGGTGGSVSCSVSCPYQYINVTTEQIEIYPSMINYTPVISVTSPSPNDTLLHNILGRERSE